MVSCLAVGTQQKIFIFCGEWRTPIYLSFQRLCLTGGAESEHTYHSLFHHYLRGRGSDTFTLGRYAAVHFPPRGSVGRHSSPMWASRTAGQKGVWEEWERVLSYSQSTQLLAKLWDPWGRICVEQKLT